MLFRGTLTNALLSILVTFAGTIIDSNLLELGKFAFDSDWNALESIVVSPEPKVNWEIGLYSNAKILMLVILSGIIKFEIRL